MTAVIRLFPSRLNLNGDQANALVLQQRAAWAGLNIDVIDHEDVSTLEPITTRVQEGGEPLVVILGHGSRAAMASIAHLKSQIENFLALCKEKSHAVLVIGSSTEWLLEHSKTERVSEFWSGFIRYEGSEFEVFGYLNSEASLDAVWVDGSLLYTLLHGPVLAKSSGLADYLISRLTGKDTKSAKTDEILNYELAAIRTARGQ